MTLDVSWSLNPVAIVLAAAAWVAYFVAWRGARRRPRETEPGDARLACMSGAVLLALVALVSPIARLGEQMFGFHMIQHLLLLDLVPILVVFAITAEVLGPALEPLRRLERRLRFLLHPVTVIALYAGGMWVLHIRPMYELALGSGGWHALQHGWLLLTGLLFWWYAVGAIRPLQRPRGMGVFGFVTATKLLTGGLATAILGTTIAHYPWYENAPRLAGMDVGEDRGLAGGLMLFEELVVLSVALGIMFIRMLDESEEEERELDAAHP